MSLEDHLNGTATAIPRESSLSGLLWGLPRLLGSLSKAVEEQAHEVDSLPNRSSITSFNYFVSPYAGACMFMAIVLNRTVVFASSRRQSDRLAKGPRIVLRLISLFLILSTMWDVVVQFGYLYPGFGDYLGEYLPAERQQLDSLLWEVFMTLCASQFLETFVSITSAQQSMNDTGLTLFEHSLAFQESQYLSSPSPQLLIICVFSLVTHIVIHVLGLSGWKKYQLIPSTILGIAFLGFYCYSTYIDTLVYFPWIVVVSLIPQVLVLLIITLCLVIYGLAVLVIRDPSSLTYTPMISNLKDSLNLQLHDDFNSLLMRFGFIMFNAVENEEYVNEMSELQFSKGTYQDHNHLVSGYFNKLDNNPELMEKTKMISGDEDSIIKNWSFLKKIVNIWKLGQGLFKLVIKLGKTNQTPKTSSSKSDGHASTHNASTSSFINDRDEIDDSEDYIPENESDYDPLEYDSEVDEDQEDVTYISTLAMARVRDATPTIPNATQPRPRPIDELFTPLDAVNMIVPSDLEDASLINAMRTHILKDTRLTRSKYCAVNEDELLHEVILQKRPHHQDKDDDDDDLSCVVCQTERRCVVLWPCKCFALCESCRLSLGVRGFAICVCCRAKVDGYSKVYMP